MTHVAKTKPMGLINGCAFCDVRYAHAGELISHLTTTCAASMWQDSDGAPDGYVA